MEGPPAHGKPILLHTLGVGETTHRVAVDPDGRILLPITRWKGDLLEVAAKTSF